MRFIKLIGKYLNDLAAACASATEGFQMFKLLKSGAMLGGIAHGNLLFILRNLNKGRFKIVPDYHTHFLFSIFLATSRP